MQRRDNGSAETRSLRVRTLKFVRCLTWAFGGGMIKVTAVLSSKNITTLAEPCHTNIVRSHEIAGGEALC